MTDKLTDKQDLFCREYIVDFNATQAAIRAGYSEKTANVIASQNLSKLNISNRINELMKKRQEKTDIDAEMVLSSILRVAKECETDDKYNPASALKGYELLGKHLSLFSDKILNQHLDKDGNPTDAPALEVKFVKSDTDNNS